MKVFIVYADAGAEFAAGISLAKKQSGKYSIDNETVGETSVSSGRWGEDGCRKLAGAVHFHVASPAFITISIAADSASLAAFFFVGSISRRKAK